MFLGEAVSINVDGIRTGKPGFNADWYSSMSGGQAYSVTTITYSTKAIGRLE
jgi:hypothetical protein